MLKETDQVYVFLSRVPEEPERVGWVYTWEGWLTMVAILACCVWWVWVGYELYRLVPWVLTWLA